MEEFIATRDCVIVGHPGIVREGERITLSHRAAKYPLLKGWIAPPPAPQARDPAPRRRRQPRK